MLSLQARLTLIAREGARNLATSAAIELFDAEMGGYASPAARELARKCRLAADNDDFDRALDYEGKTLARIRNDYYCFVTNLVVADRRVFTDRECSCVVNIVEK